MSDLRSRHWKPVLFLLAAALVMLVLFFEPGGILFWRAGEYSDLLISHWPNAGYLGQSLRTWGQLPLWNPMILGGAPFLADPLSGFWYPPLWLAAILPAPWSFNLLLGLHLAVLGWGTYRLGRRLGLERAGATFAGLAAMWAPKWIGHAGLGHISLVMAVSWTPWLIGLWMRVEQGWEAGRGWRLALFAGAAIGAVFLIDPRWAYWCGLLALAILLRQLAHSQKLGIGTRLTALRQVVLQSLVALPAALGIAAGLALPLLEFVRLSTRASLEFAEAQELSLPPIRLLGLLAPDFQINPEWQLYAGVVVVFLSLLALRTHSPGTRFWGLLTIISLLWALGEYTPFYAWVVRWIPGSSLLRVPPRSLFITSLCLAILAAKGLERIVDPTPLLEKQRRDLNLFTVALGAFLAGFGAMLLVFRPAAADASTWTILSPYLFAVLLLLGVRLWLWLPARLNLARRHRVWGWIGLLGISLLPIGWMNVEARPVSVIEDPQVKLAQMHIDDNAARLFSPSYSLSQPQAGFRGLELTDGINPLQLRTTWEYMARATGFDDRGYSVTLPPFRFGPPDTAWEVEPDARLLGMFNVSLLVSAFPIQAPDWELLDSSDRTYIYRNSDLRPRAWVISSSSESQPWYEPQDLMWSPNRIRVTARGPGTLVLSEVGYPGWRVRVDGHVARLDRFEGLFRSVELEAGEHRVEFTFFPISLILGIAFTLLTLIGLVVSWRKAR